VSPEQEALTAPGRIERWLHRLARVGLRALVVLRRALRQYGETEASQAAAALAYYLFFSLFPLALLLVAAATYLWHLGDEEGFQEAVDFIGRLLPVSQELIVSNLRVVVRLRGAFTPLSALTTLWSASSAFTVLSHHINRAWVDARPRSYLGKRLVALVMVAILIMLLFLSLGSATLVGYLPRLESTNPQIQALERTVRSALVRLLPPLITMVLFLGLFHWRSGRDGGAGIRQAAFRLGAQTGPAQLQHGLRLPVQRGAAALLGLRGRQHRAIRRPCGGGGG